MISSGWKFISDAQHEKLKILVIKKKTTINKFILDYIIAELKKDEENGEKN